MGPSTTRRSYVTQLEALLATKDEEINALRTQNATHLSKISLLNSRLLHALDTLDVLRDAHSLEMSEIREVISNMQVKMGRWRDAKEEAEVERDDMRDAVLRLVEKVEKENDYRRWPYSQMQLSSLSDPVVDSVPQPAHAAHRHQHRRLRTHLDQDQDLDLSTRTLESYAPSMIHALIHECDAERTAHSRTRQQVVRLEARVARREVELEACVCMRGRVVIDGAQAQGQGQGEGEEEGKARVEGREQGGEGEQEQEQMPSEQIIAMLDVTVARNRVLELEIKTLIERLAKARTASSLASSTSSVASTSTPRPEPGPILRSARARSSSDAPVHTHVPVNTSTRKSPTNEVLDEETASGRGSKTPTPTPTTRATTSIFKSSSSRPKQKPRPKDALSPSRHPPRPVVFYPPPPRAGNAHIVSEVPHADQAQPPDDQDQDQKARLTVLEGLEREIRELGHKIDRFRDERGAWMGAVGDIRADGGARRGSVVSGIRAGENVSHSPRSQSRTRIPDVRTAELEARVVFLEEECARLREANEALLRARAQEEWVREQDERREMQEERREIQGEEMQEMRDVDAEEDVRDGEAREGEVGRDEDDLISRRQEGPRKRQRLLQEHEQLQLEPETHGEEEDSARIASRTVDHGEQETAHGNPAASNAAANTTPTSSNMDISDDPVPMPTSASALVPIPAAAAAPVPDLLDDDDDADGEMSMELATPLMPTSLMSLRELDDQDQDEDGAGLGPHLDHDGGQGLQTPQDRPQHRNDQHGEDLWDDLRLDLQEQNDHEQEQEDQQDTVRSPFVLPRTPPSSSSPLPLLGGRASDNSADTAPRTPTRRHASAAAPLIELASSPFFVSAPAPASRPTPQPVPRSPALAASVVSGAFASPSILDLNELASDFDDNDGDGQSLSFEAEYLEQLRRRQVTYAALSASLSLSDAESASESVGVGEREEERQGGSPVEYEYSVSHSEDGEAGSRSQSEGDERNEYGYDSGHGSGSGSGMGYEDEHRNGQRGYEHDHEREHRFDSDMEGEHEHEHEHEHEPPRSEDGEPESQSPSRSEGEVEEGWRRIENELADARAALEGGEAALAYIQDVVDELELNVDG